MWHTNEPNNQDGANHDVANHDAAILVGANELSREEQLAPLQVEVQVVLLVPAASVFAAVTDHQRLCELVPNQKEVCVYESAEGVVRRCDFGNDMIVEEQIVRWDPPHEYAYAAITPNPFGLRHHYATVTCKPVEGGTLLRWQHYFEHDDLEAMLSMLNEMFDHIFAELLDQFGGQRLS